MKKLVRTPLPPIKMNVVNDLIGGRTYEELLESHRGWWQQVSDNKDHVQRWLNKSNLPDLNEDHLEDLLRSLWTVKHSPRSVHRIVEEMLEHGMQRVSKALDYLLYSDQPLAKRFDYAESQIKNLGAARISELLWLQDCTKYPLWTRFSKEGLEFLGVFEEFQKRVSGQKSGGERYVVVREFASGLLSQIKPKHSTFNDFMALDLILFYVESESRRYPE